MANEKRMKRVTLVLVVIALVIILTFLLLRKTPSSGNIYANNSYGSPQNQNSTAEQNNTPYISAAKSNYTYNIPTDWGQYAVDLPNDIVSIVITGNYNTVNVTSQTETSQVAFYGTNNKITFCMGSYQHPNVIDNAVNNQVTYSNC